MNVEDTLKTYLLKWPFTMTNKLAVLDQLLLVYGNGMEWRNGELVALCADEETPPTMEDAVHNVIRSTFSKKIEPWSEEWLHDEVSLIFRLEERMNDMSVATQQKYPYSFVRESAKVDRLHRIFYPICGFSAICDLPDDIKPDWLTAAKEMYEFIDSHQELIADVDQKVFSGWMPRIKARIEELEHMNPNRKILKWLYRLEAVSKDNGLWYNSDNEYVWGCRDCKGDAKNLPMGYDARYHIDGKNWFSSCSNKEDLLHWYSKEDAEWLLEHGFVFTRYLARDYHEFDKETVFLKETAIKREVIDFLTLFEEN